MPSSKDLTATEQEFAWLMEEYFFLHPTAKKKLAFWFVELHASDEFGEEIKDRQDFMSEVQWKKAGKVNIFVKKSRLEEFHRFREAVRQKLRSGYVRDRMKDPFEERDAASSVGAPGTPRGLSVSFSQENDDDEFDETGVLPENPIDIMPKHKKGDRVFAAWIDNLLEDGELSWFAGTIKGYSATEKRGHYGEGRVYHVEFDDGDVDTNLKDIYVMSEKDYYLVEKGFVANNSKSDITKISGVGDEYAETVGWYKTSYTGDKAFGLLSDAVKARDSKVVERKGQYVTEADLIFLMTGTFRLSLPRECRFGMDAERLSSMMITLPMVMARQNLERVYLRGSSDRLELRMAALIPKMMNLHVEPQITNANRIRKTQRMVVDTSGIKDRICTIPQNLSSINQRRRL